MKWISSHSTLRMTYGIDSVRRETDIRTPVFVLATATGMPSGFAQFADVQPPRRVRTLRADELRRVVGAPDPRFVAAKAFAAPILEIAVGRIIRHTRLLSQRLAVGGTHS